LKQKCGEEIASMAKRMERARQKEGSGPVTGLRTGFVTGSSLRAGIAKHRPLKCWERGKSEISLYAEN
jgi:hypothetical protein